MENQMEQKENMQSCTRKLVDSGPNSETSLGDEERHWSKKKAHEFEPPTPKGKEGNCRGLGEKMR